MSTVAAPEAAAREYWVVVVADRGDPERGISRYERRFTFDGDMAAAEAWACWANATRSGFTAHADRVTAAPARRVTSGRSE